MPDIPDRIMEIDAQGNPVRVLSRGSTVYEGMRVEKVRSWFVGPDGLTEPEREIKALREQAAKQGILMRPNVSES